MQMNPIMILSSGSAVEKAYRQIKSRIIHFELKPGSRLRAQELAESLELSRTPIRETLGRLEHEGLVVRTGGWGYVVRRVSVKEIVDLFAVRQSLEAQVISDVIPLVTEGLLRRLEALLGEQERHLAENRVQDFRKKSRNFHLMLLSTTQNDLLRSILNSIDDRVRLVGAIIHDARTDRARQVFEENKRLFRALKRRDEPAALAAVREHLARAKEIAVGQMIEHSSQHEEDLCTAN